MKLDLLAIGVHPDDVELGCSGTIINEIKNGKKVGVLDLTQGELGSRGTIETRYEEAAKAAMIMGIHGLHALIICLLSRLISLLSLKMNLEKFQNMLV